MTQILNTLLYWADSEALSTMGAVPHSYNLFAHADGPFAFLMSSPSFYSLH